MILKHAITRLVKPGMVALDIGANRGQTAQLLSEVGAVTYSFEPIAECVAEIEARKLPNVTIVKTALSDEEGIAEFHLDERVGAGMEASSLRVLEGVIGKTITVPVTTIDRFVAKNAIVPDFIKIDVEGVEEKVIAGGMQTIRRHRPIIIFEVWGNNWPRLESTVRDLSSMYRFECASDGSDAIERYSAGIVTENDDVICLPA
jgi:FkbM family methyltransferase